MKQIVYFAVSVFLLMLMTTSGYMNNNSNSKAIHTKDENSDRSVVECNDGIDNDGDGLIDWQYDTGCADRLDNDETAGVRAKENGFTTFDPGKDSIIIYVSSSKGNIVNDGTSPQKAVSTLARAASLVRDGHNDFILLRRGDTWRGESLGRFKSGRDADHPMVIASYGESIKRPRIEVDRPFIDHDGHARSFVAVSGLQIVSYPKIPGDPAFNGAAGGAFRYVGGGTGLLIEDCHVLYGELIIQSYGGYHYKNVEIRRNIVEHTYHVGTCGHNAVYRPSGIYTSHVTGLIIEGNIFDHNGWNEDVASACATMFNHNMYLNARGLIVRDNIISRASCMGIKMRSDTAGDAKDLLLENNLLVDGEIGIGIGGNTDKPHRFDRVIIRRNIFSQIGMSSPTKRSFAWMLQVLDNKNTVIENNYFLHQPWHARSYGIQLGGGSESNIKITGNIFYDLKQCAISVRTAGTWKKVMISGNTIVDPAHGSCLVDHKGDFDNVVYQRNRYFSRAGHEWFCIDGSRQSLVQWRTVSGENNAVSWAGVFTDPARTVGSYAGTLGLQNTTEGFLRTAKKQSRLNWKRELTANAVNDYIRAGFN